MKLRKIKNIDLHNLDFVFQPICSREDEIVFVECLTRITNLDMTTHEFFLSIDDHTKLRFFFAQLSFLKRNKFFFERSKLMVTVNVSFKNVGLLYDRSIIKMVEELHFVNLELNELSQQLLSSDALSKLSNLYDCLWLDDFGSGLSNFDLIHKKRVKYIKIDRYMFWKSFSSKEGRNMLHNLIEYLTSEGYYVVIEGIESLLHFEWLKKNLMFCRARISMARNEYGYFETQL